MDLSRPLVVLQKLTPAIIVLVINTALDFAITFGWLALEPPQRDAINNLVNVACLLLVLYGVISATGSVTPVSDPQLPTGTQVRVTTPEGDPTHTTTIA